MKNFILDNAKRIIDYRDTTNTFAKSDFIGNIIKRATNKNKIDFIGVNNVWFDDNNKIIGISGYTIEKGLFIEYIK